MRVLAILIVLGLVASADAQVFKPKGKKSEATEKKPSKKAAAKKKSTKSTKAKKKSTKTKKSAVAERSRPDDADSEDDDNAGDKDYVKITDDDEIE